MSQANPLPEGAEARLQAWIDDPAVAAALQARDWKTAFLTYTYLEIDNPPFTLPRKPLRAMNLLAITSGGLYINGEQPPFNAADVYGDPRMRLIPIDTPYARLRIAHDHYDHTVPEQDLHTIDPVDHLKTLHTQGVIGGIEDQQISFHGYIPVWTRVFDQLIPAVLDTIKGKPIDGVLLVPV